MLKLLLGFAIPLVAALSCQYQWQCTSVSTNYNYVECVNGQCQCLPTFSGSATTSSPCDCGPNNSSTTYVVNWQANPYTCKSCTAPAQFYYDNSGTPYCVDLAVAEAQSLNYEKWLNLVQMLFVDYTNQTIATQIVSGQLNVSQYFTETPLLRAAPIGTATYPGGLYEYYYGLAAVNPITKAVLRDFAIDTVGGSYNTTRLYGQGQVCVKIDYYFELALLTGVARYAGCLRINEQGLIWSADLIAPLFGEIFNPQISTPFALSYLINQTCDRWFQYCVPLGFTDYPTFEDCSDFMYAVSPGQTYDQMASNSSICRQFHSNLAISNPEIHCPHMSINGGGQCYDVPLSTYFGVDY